MSQSKDELVVAARGHIYLAPGGTTLPDDRDPRARLAPAYFDLGYTTTDGVGFSHSQRVEDVEAWQKDLPILTIVNARQLSTRYTLMQVNRATIPLAFGGGAWTSPTAGVYRYNPPSSADGVLDYVQVIDFDSGEKKYRVVIVRGNVVDDVEMSLTRTRPSELPITMRGLAPDDDGPGWYLVTDDASAAEAS